MAAARLDLIVNIQHHDGQRSPIRQRCEQYEQKEDSHRGRRTGLYPAGAIGAAHFEIREENDSRRALETARQFRPDLIFLDVVMPELDGAAVAAQLREDGLLSRVPIVFLTAIVAEREATVGKPIGGFPFLAKPISKEMLLECIHRELGE